MIKELKDILTVKTFKGINKKRIGSVYDGGYLIVTNYTKNNWEIKYDCYIGCGIGNNADFENDIYSIW